MTITKNVIVFQVPTNTYSSLRRGREGEGKGREGEGRGREGEEGKNVSLSYLVGDKIASIEKKNLFLSSIFYLFLHFLLFQA